MQVSLAHLGVNFRVIFFLKGQLCLTFSRKNSAQTTTSPWIIALHLLMWSIETQGVLISTDTLPREEVSLHGKIHLNKNNK